MWILRPAKLGLIFLFIFVLIIGFLGCCSQSDKIQDGFGKASLPDGSIYEGEFKNGLFNGLGTLRGRNGTIYQGQFRDGLYNGKGRVTFPDGSAFEGEFRNGIEHGQGKYINKSDNGDAVNY